MAKVRVFVLFMLQLLVKFLLDYNLMGQNDGISILAR